MYTGYSNEVSSSPLSFPAGSDWIEYNKYQFLGQAILSRLGTVSGSIIQVECVSSSCLWRTNGYSQFALLL